MLVFLVLLGAMSAPALRGQVAPVNDTSVPLTLPDGPLPAPAGQGEGVPIAHLRGWSFRNELSGGKLLQGSEVSLDPKHSDILLFFDAGPNGVSGAEFGYRLDGYDADWTVTRQYVAQLPSASTR